MIIRLRNKTQFELDFQRSRCGEVGVKGGWEVNENVPGKRPDKGGNKGVGVVGNLMWLEMRMQNGGK